MTREEAIKLLELLEKCATIEESKECCKLAIEALKQTEIVRCRDCCFYAISKQKRSWCKDMLRRIQPDDFCSRGRRREE